MIHSKVIGKFAVVAGTATVGEIMDLIEDYLALNDMTMSDLDVEKLLDNSKALFEIRNIVKALPIVESLFSKLVTITNSEDGSVLTYKAMSLGELMETLELLKQANSDFFTMAQNLLSIDPQS